MPVSVSYPGVYIEEVPSGVRTIVGVPTAITAFVGRARRGPVDEPRRISSQADFQRIYGGLWSDSMVSYAVDQYYQNGGSEAIIVRIHNGAESSKIVLKNGPALEAKYPGEWGKKLRVRVDYKTSDPADTNLYNLTVRDTGTGNEEKYLNVSIVAASPRALDKVLQSSALIKATEGQDKRPEKHDDVTGDEDPFKDPVEGAGGGGAGGGAGAGGAGGEAAGGVGKYTQATGGSDGNELTDTQYVGDESKKTGIYALLKTDIFNLLIVPPISRGKDIAVGTLAKAAKLCLDRRAMLLVDAPAEWDLDKASGNARDMFVGTFGSESARNAALFFPRIRMADSEMGGALEYFAPTGAVAGVFARTDANRGVWKAPAGTDAALSSVRELKVPLTDKENGRLNPLGVNCIRTFPVYGTLVWGARTLRGADQLADLDYKYIPIRRLTLFIEESLYRGTQWVVFEPNDEPLWAQIRLNVGAFMNSLFRQGAFQGSSARDAYFVRCDKDTTPQDDRNKGIVNIIVGFAPLKPAEFVIIKIQQMAGQILT
jgi:phage tail sheath protein FI